MAETNPHGDATRWNARYPIGTPVTAYPGVRPEDGDGKRLDTRTRSEAQVLGGTAVVWVDGHGACIALTHVDPVQSADTYTPPAPYRRSDGVLVCCHTTPVGPGSCDDCWDLVKWDAVNTPVTLDDQAQRPTACASIRASIADGGAPPS
ncbi:hypothetical protein AB0912_15435 [Streptomyces sp. NPDC007084]|uniref:hypothetical protein n=1 Tax=Streptomyces sp. NPDC007084 TaxID=3154313 RepID=UPI003454B4D4